MHINIVFFFRKFLIKYYSRSKSSSLQVPDQNRRLNNVFMIKSADEEKELPFSLSEKKFLPNTEEFMVMVFQLSSISTIKFPNYFANMYSIIEATNSTVMIIRKVIFELH